MLGGVGGEVWEVGGVVEEEFGCGWGGEGSVGWVYEVG